MTWDGFDVHAPSAANTAHPAPTNTALRPISGMPERLSQRSLISKDLGMTARRRESMATLFWLLLLAAAVGGLWWYWQSQEPDPEPPPAIARPADAQEVRVNFLQDGDSLEVAALAPGKWISTTDPVQVRLLGIDAPEMHGADGLPQCWAEAAKAELLRLAPFGGRLWIVGDIQAQDQYGRYLVYAWTPDGAFVNERVAELGAVRELSIPPNFGYEQRLHDKIADARDARRGLWGTCVN